ncbi:uncharacterized protein JN550_006169 [Neoarthrinium moseri]|uniref:uncharacterized protein n=1 Tax=Neoarthrinium moseri TaxID=1658444 RepID=UPI001FDD7ACE|nr:uncharacterized protein JN550_006169 [Neoarthrinium moseri]KAI1868594.1 hypothetical protein JN550_006169 [Neoarthrinium moseri]
MATVDRAIVYNRRLDPSRKQIRLLTVLPATDDSKLVHCRLKTVSLVADLRYIALSYVWGDPDVTLDVVVNGLVFGVTENLASALWYFREYDMLRGTHGEPLRLWVDALCINQKDLKERAQQVAFMGSVYGQATHVFSWLCAPNKNEHRVDEGIRTVREVMAEMEWEDISDDETVKDKGKGEYSDGDCSTSESDSHSYHCHSKSPLDDPSREEVEQFTQEIIRRPELCRNNMKAKWVNTAWSAIIQLETLKYWNRIWVYQEMILAKQTTDCHFLVIGNEMVLAVILNEFRSLFLGMLIEFENTAKKPSAMGSETWRRLIARRWAIIGTTLKVTWIVKESMNHRDLVLHWIFYTISSCEASDPRDMVYAWLGILNLDIQPDYEKTVKDVYLDWCKYTSTEWAADTEGPALCLNDILRGAGLAGREGDAYGLPSWIPDLSKPRINPYDLVSFSTKAFFDLDRHHSCYEDILKIHGAQCGGVLHHVQIDFESHDNLWRYFFHDLVMSKPKNETEISLKLDVSYEHQCLATFLRGIDPTTSSRRLLGKDKLDGFWQLLGFFALISSNISDAQFLIEPLLTGGSSGANENKMARAARRQRPLKKRFSEVAAAHFVDRLEEHLTRLEGSYFFETETGYLGIGGGVQVDDKICILNGCEFPVIMRRTADSWVYIGPCHVYGISTIDPAEVIKRDNLDVQWFEIS